MKPGDKLDKKIADIVYPTWRDDFGKPDWSDLPHYSTDISAAWVAWEWLEKNNPWNESLIIGRLHRQEGFSPFVGHYGLDDIIAWGNTYPHAICLAVLASVNNENKK